MKEFLILLVFTFGLVVLLMAVVLTILYWVGGLKQFGLRPDWLKQRDKDRLQYLKDVIAKRSKP